MKKKFLLISLSFNLSLAMQDKDANNKIVVGVLTVRSKNGLSKTPGSNINFLQRIQQNNTKKQNIERDDEASNAYHLTQLLASTDIEDFFMIGHTPYTKNDKPFHKVKGGSGALAHLIISEKNTGKNNLFSFATGSLDMSGKIIPIGSLLFKLSQACSFLKKNETPNIGKIRTDKYFIPIFLPKSMIPYAKFILDSCKTSYKIKTPIQLIGVHHASQIPMLLSQIKHSIPDFYFEKLNYDYELSNNFETEIILNYFLQSYHNPDQKIQRSFTFSNEIFLIEEFVTLAILNNNNKPDALSSMLEAMTHKGKYQSYTYFLSFFANYITNENFISYDPQNRFTFTSLLEPFVNKICEHKDQDDKLINNEIHLAENIFRQNLHDCLDFLLRKFYYMDRVYSSKIKQSTNDNIFNDIYQKLLEYKTKIEKYEMGKTHFFSHKEIDDIVQTEQTKHFDPADYSKKINPFFMPPEKWTTILKENNSLKSTWIAEIDRPWHPTIINQYEIKMLNNILIGHAGKFGEKIIKNIKDMLNYDPREKKKDANYKTHFRNLVNIIEERDTFSVMHAIEDSILDELELHRIDHPYFKYDFRDFLLRLAKTTDMSEELAWSKFYYYIYMIDKMIEKINNLLEKKDISEISTAENMEVYAYSNYINFLVSQIDFIMNTQSNNLQFLLPAFKLIYDYFIENFNTIKDHNSLSYDTIWNFIKNLFHLENPTFKLLLLNKIMQEYKNQNKNFFKLFRKNLQNKIFNKENKEYTYNYYSDKIPELIIDLIADICTSEQQKAFIKLFKEDNSIQNFILLMRWFDKIQYYENIHNDFSTIYPTIDMEGGYSKKPKLPSWCIKPEIEEVIIEYIKNTTILSTLNSIFPDETYKKYLYDFMSFYTSPQIMKALIINIGKEEHSDDDHWSLQPQWILKKYKTVIEKHIEQIRIKKEKEINYKYHKDILDKEYNNRKELKEFLAKTQHENEELKQNLEEIIEILNNYYKNDIK